MRNLKRTLSLALAALMLMSMMVVSAGAATKDFTDSSEIQNKEAVEVMVALNVISGKDDGSYFAPNDTLTREEMAKVVSYVMNGGVEPVVGTKVNPTYSDIKGIWSEKYIEYCTSMGIINGDGAGKFNPTGTLTAEQAAKMFLTAMGYNANVFGFTGNDWAINVGRYANEAGLYKNLGDVVPSQPISRDDACQMAYNAIQGTMMKRTWSQDLTTGQLTETYVPWTSEDNNGVSYPVTLLGQKFDGVIKLAYMEDFSYDSTKKMWTYDFRSTGASQFGGSAISDDKGISGTGHGVVALKSDVDYTAFYGQQVKVIYNTKDNEVIYGVYANDSSVVVEGATGNVEDYNNTADTVTVAGTDYKLNGDANTIVVYDFGVGNATTLDTLKANATGTNLSAYTFKMVDNTGDGKIDAVIRTPMTVAKINYVGKDSVQFGSGVATQKLDDLVTYDGFAAGDWVCFINAANSVYSDNTIQKLDLQTAAVSGVRGGATANVYTEYQVNDTWLAASGDSTYAGLIAKADVNDTVEYISLGSTIFYAKIVDIAATTKNIAMIVTADDTTGSNNVHGSVAEAKLLLADGTTKVVTVSKITYYGGTTTPTVDDSVVAADITANIGIGQLVTYRVDGSNYELTEVCASNLAGYKAIKSESTGGNTAYNNGKIAGVELADDAVVYFIANDGASTPADPTDNGNFAAAAGRKSDVYTGKEIKNTWGTGSKTIATGAGAGSGQTQDTNTVDYVTVLTQEINGFTYAKVVLIADETALPKVTTGSNYGYLAAATSRTVEDGKTYLNYTIHTANGELKVKEENTDAPQDYPQGAVITYDVVSEGIVKNVNVVKSDMVTGKVTGWDGVDKIALDGYSTEIDANDTTIIYVDSDKKVGAEGGSIQKFADYNGDGIANGSEPDNVRYVLSSSKDYVVFLLVDINNEMKANPVAMELSGDLSAEDIEKALSNGSATVDASNLEAVGTVNVAKGQTLTITNTSTTNALTVNVAEGATLKVTDTSITDGMLIIKVAAGGAVELPNGKLFGTDGAAVVIDPSLTRAASEGVEVEVKAANNGGVYVISSDAEIKMVKNLTLGTKDGLELTGTAKLTGTAGVSITFNASMTKLTVNNNNFYDDPTDADADGVSAGATYKWTTFTVTGTNTQVTGWLKQQ